MSITIFYNTSLPWGEQAVKLAPHKLCPAAHSNYLVPTVTFLLYT